MPFALAAQASTLRQPEQSVFAAYPDADGYQAIVRDISSEARRRIEASLPFRVHFNEIGQHAVYVALHGRLPLGMVYLLREEDSFGLTEFEWAISLDMRLAGFRFQRTRSRHRQAIVDSEFARLLIGRSAAELALLINEDGGLSKHARGVPEGCEESATVLVRSALKALSVVDSVWFNEVQKLRDLALGMQAFPTALRFVRVWPPAATPTAAAAKTPPLQPAPQEAHPDVVVALRASGLESRSLGVVAMVRVLTIPDLVVTWVIDHAGLVIATEAAGTAPAAIRVACTETVGQQLGDVAANDGPLSASAAALDRLLQPHPHPGR